MVKKYYRWKDENCVGGEFTDDDILLMEVTAEQYKMRKQGNNRTEYCKRLRIRVRLVAFDEEMDEAEELTRREVIADEKLDTAQKSKSSAQNFNARGR